MFGFISEVALLNVQSHKKSIFKFKGTGLHRISAEGTSNSFGKSVLRKALYTVFTPDNKSLDGRKALINYGSEDCYIIVSSTTGILITLYLHLEEKKCYYELEFEGELIRKYLRDDYQIILDILCFHYMAEEGYSLNFYKTKTALPFTHFRPRLNNKILDSASELPHYRIIMEDIEMNLNRMIREVSIIENTQSSFEFHLSSIAQDNIEDMFLEEKRLELWLGYIEPLEEVNPLGKSLITAYQEIASIEYIQTDILVDQIVQLDILNSCAKPLQRLIESQDQLTLLRVIEASRVHTYIEVMSSLSESKKLISSVKESNETLSELNNKSLHSEVTSLYKLMPFDDSSKSLKELARLKFELDSVPRTCGLPVLTINNLDRFSALNTSLQALLKYKTNLDSLEVDNCKISKSHLSSLEPVNSVRDLILKLLELKRELIESNTLKSSIQADLELIEKDLDICQSCGQMITKGDHHEHLQSN